MSDVLSPKVVRDVLTERELKPSKALGQNFVCDKNTVDKIIFLADIDSTSSVLEIGPGLGALTVPLVKKGFKVLAVEKDLKLAERLDGESLPGLKVLAMDAMKLDWGQLLATPWPELIGAPFTGKSEFFTVQSGSEKIDPLANDALVRGGMNWHLVANLPYNIATHLIISILEQAESVTEMLVMVQKEVGLRLCADPGSKVYGISTLKLSYFARSKIVGKISREVFFPKPNVDSVLVQIRRRTAEEIAADFAGYDVISYLAGKAFSQRRKMLRHSLRNVLQEADYGQAMLSSTLRPEQLDINDWSRLAKCYKY